MKINLILGAGQLGSRHLQAMLLLKQEQEIYILDPSVTSLEIAKKRALEISHQHKLHFVSEWHILPKKIDLSIIATGANVRASVTTKLLENFEVENLILEKVLFQDIESYAKIASLIESTNTATWVNHPRRMAKYYQDIRDTIAKTNERIVFNVFGSHWGLACNGLHQVDLCAFLSGSELETIDFNWVDDVIHESKRKSFIEFTGSVKGKMKNNSAFLITSVNGEIGDITISISTNSNRWIVQEGSAQKVIRLAKENAFNEEIINFKTAFQSTLTNQVANEIFETGTCDLPTFSEACASHIPFITAALNKYIQITGTQTTICPIT
jgi:siroheme synthase (precorrin-2 oxidase/ferrochelatase)